MKQSERGQSALLGVVALLVLAIAMYTTYNLSHAVYEKIELQNAADATAYSLATMEARTFNYVAFANRAQIANYVQMMEMQSLFSHVLYLEAATGMLSDLLLATGRSLKLLPWTSSLGAALESAGQLIYQTAYQAAAKARQVLESYVPNYIKVKTSANNALFATGLMMALSTSAQLAAGATDITQANDPDARWNPVGVIPLRALNTAAFLNAFDFAAWNPRGTGDRSVEARRLMTEMIHGTRYSTGVFGADFIAARKPTEMMEGLFGLVANQVNDDNPPRGAADNLKAVGDALALLLGPGYRGTTKLLEDSGKRSELADATADDAHGKSDLPAGELLFAKDKPLGFGAFPTVISGPNRGEYCYYNEPTGITGHGKVLGLFRILGQIVTGIGVYECKEDASNLRWQTALPFIPGGIQPYFKLAAHRKGITVAEGGFNQPDVWVWLTKQPSAMQLGNDRDLNFEITRGNERAELDARIGEDGLFNSGLGKGMHAIARAQVYYHRPGAWREPPNFFNPYWGARLARKGEALDRLFEFLPGPVANYLSDSMWMH